MTKEQLVSKHFGDEAYSDQFSSMLDEWGSFVFHCASLKRILFPPPNNVFETYEEFKKWHIEMEKTKLPVYDKLKQESLKESEDLVKSYYNTSNPAKKKK